MGESGWRWTDAWIFVSLVIASGAGRHRRAADTSRPEGVRLTDVLSTAEHLNQAIPEREDVEAAVRRLAGAGLVSVSDGWFRITPDGERLWRTRPSAGVGTTVDTVQGVLVRRHTPGSAPAAPPGTVATAPSSRRAGPHSTGGSRGRVRSDPGVRGRVQAWVGPVRGASRPQAAAGGDPVLLVEAVRASELDVR